MHEDQHTIAMHASKEGLEYSRKSNKEQWQLRYIDIYTPEAVCVSQLLLPMPRQRTRLADHGGVQQTQILRI